MWGQRLRVMTVCATLILAVMAQSKPVQANEGHGLAAAIVPALVLTTGAAALNITSIVASSIYLGKKKHSPLGWQILSYSAGGLTLGTGLFFGIGSAVNGYIDAAAWITVGVGAATLTLGILAATLNRKKTLPPVVLVPVLLRDMEGRLAPGIGLTLTSF